MKYILLAALCFSSSAFAEARLSKSQQELLGNLNAHAGNYVLSSNSATHPCLFLLRDAEKSPFSFHAEVVETADEFHSVGDIDAKLKFTQDDKDFHAFDRADFGAVNAGTRRSYVQGMVISHQSLFDASKQKLSHSVTMTAITGGELALQEVQFTSTGFTYDYSISERNALGFTTKTENYDHCEFTKAE